MSEALTATAAQFGKLVVRMMPPAFSCMPEGRLIAAILAQAWSDASESPSARRFFAVRGEGLDYYCEKTGLNAQQLRELYLKHHHIERESLELESASVRQGTERKA
jgi:hypothetical protein